MYRPGPTLQALCLAGLLFALSSTFPAEAADSVATAFGKIRAAGISYGPRSGAAVLEFYGKLPDASQSSPHYSQLRLGVEWEDMLTGDRPSAGLSATYCYHHVFWSGRVARGGESLSLYAGPGLGLSLGNDADGLFGLAAGILADVGADLRLGIPLVVSLNWSAAWAYHLSRKQEGDWRVHNYRNGWRRAYLPSLAFKYDFHDRERRGSAPRFHRFTYGLDAHLQTSFFSRTHANFFNGEGSRIDARANAFELNLRGSFLLHAGVYADPRWSFCLYGGYESIQPGASCWPLTLRVTHFFRDSWMPGPFCYLDGGAAFAGHGMLHRRIAIGKAGAGWRIPTGSRSSLDFVWGLRITRSHPMVYDGWSDEWVQKEKLNRSDALVLAFDTGFSLSF